MSDYTLTPSLGLYKPTTNADSDLWGDHWNLNADTLDSAIYSITSGGPFLSTSAAAATYLPLSQRGVANGVASLDATGVVPTSQLPGTVTGTLNYRGGWDASTNTPVMTSGAHVGGVVQAAGNYYVVTVAATTAAIDGLTTWNAGDWISSNGTIWQRVQNSTSPYLPLTGGVISGQTTFSAPFNAIVVNNSMSVTTGITTGSLTVTGTTATIGALASTTNQFLNLQSTAAHSRLVRGYTGSTLRWDIGTDPTAESGGNAGSNFIISAYNDAGVFTGSILQGARGSGPGGTGNPYILNLRPFQMSQSRATTPGGVAGNDMTFPITGIDVQPVTTLGNNPISVTSGSAVVTIAWTGCGATGGVFSASSPECYVNLLGVTATGGITPTGWLKGTRVDNDHFSVTWTSSATGTATGGGAAVTVQPNFVTITQKLHSVVTGGTSGFPVQYMSLFVANPAFFKVQGGGAGPGPQYQQDFRQVYTPNDTSGLNSWGTMGTELDLINRGPDTGYSPNLYSVVNPTVGFWTGAFDSQISAAIAPGGGTTQNWNTVFSIFNIGKVGSYVGYSVQPNALVGAARDATTSHGGVAFVAFGSYVTINNIATTNGSNLVTISPASAAILTAVEVAGNSIYIPTVQTVRGVTFGGADYVMSNVTASTFQITGTGNATSSGSSATYQWAAYANLVPYALAEYRGSWKHGITTTEFRSEDGSIINTQPGNGLLWNDGAGTASVNSVARSPGNIDIVLDPAGTGTVRMPGLPTAATGLLSGSLWINAGVLNVVP